MSRTAGLHWLPNRADAPWIAMAGLLVVAAAAVVLWFVLPGVAEPWKSVVSVLGGSGIGGVVTAGLKYWAGASEGRQQALSKYAGGTLRPFVELADEDLRIHKPVLEAAEFLERDLTDDVCALLRAGESLVVVGPSMAGKSRLAAEAVRRTHPLRLTLTAQSGKDLADLLDKARPEHCLIWLDDLERFLTSGLTLERAGQLLSAGNILMATMRTSERAKFDVTDKVKPAGWDVFEVLHELTLGTRLSSAETIRMDRSSYAPLRDRMGAYGLAPYLGGAHQGRRRLVPGNPGADPGLSP